MNIIIILYKINHLLKEFVLSWNRELCSSNERLCVPSNEEVLVCQLMSLSKVDFFERDIHNRLCWNKAPQHPLDKPGHLFVQLVYLYLL